MDTGILHLPDELLRVLFRCVGIGAALRALPRNSRLHEAWQRAVHSITIAASSLRFEDIKIISKLTNLESLSFNGHYSEAAAIPVGHVVASVAPSLTRLTRLVLHVQDAVDALKSVYAGSMIAQLRELCVTDGLHDLRTTDIWALAALQALTKLQLSVHSIAVAPEQLRLASPRLSGILDLSLCLDDCSVSPDVMTAFPGSLVNLQKLQLCKDLDEEQEEDNHQQQEQLLTKALSALTNLRELSSNVALSSAAAQQQALGELKQLTRLELRRAEMAPEFVMLQALPDLQELLVPQHTVVNPFTHPSLLVLAAGRVEAGEQWRGKTAEECSITELTITDWQSDDDVIEDASLHNLPLLPKLGILKCGALQSGGMFEHVAALLHRQAGTLRDCELYLPSAVLEEVLPPELSACTRLYLRGRAASRATLQLLASCKLPVLQELMLYGPLAKQPLAARDLAWLAALPALRKLQVWSDGEQWDAAQAQLEALFEGSPVELQLD